MDFETDPFMTSVILKTGPNFDKNEPKITSLHDIKCLPNYDNNKYKSLGVIYENKIVVRDVDFILKKRKQFKQKQFEKIFKGAVVSCLKRKIRHNINISVFKCIYVYCTF